MTLTVDMLSLVPGMFQRARQVPRVGAGTEVREPPEETLPVSGAVCGTQ